MAMSLEERLALQGMGKALARRKHRHHYHQRLPLGPQFVRCCRCQGSACEEYQWAKST